MNDFRIVNPHNKINLGNEWVDSASFKNKGAIVDDKGNIPSTNYTGQRYRLIAEKERKFSCFERLGRGFLGVLIIISSLGTTLFSKFVKNLFTKKHESIRFGVSLDPFFSQPKEIHLKILSYLNRSDLGKCLGVSKKWQVQANTESLWKALSPPTIAFGKKQWKRYFGEIGEEPPLPRNIHKILNDCCPIWSNKKVKDTHILVLIPKTVNNKPLTLNRIEELVKAPMNGGHATQYAIFRRSIKQEYGDQPAPESHWVLMSKKLLPGSANNDRYPSKQARVAEWAKEAKINYELPNVLDAVVCIFTHYVNSKKRLFHLDPPYLFCQEKCLGAPLGDEHVIVGCFASTDGLYISGMEDSYGANNVGCSILLKL